MGANEMVHVTLHTGLFFMLSCLLLIFFKINFFLKNSFRNTIKVSNSMDLDQARHFVGPDLYPNCLQRLSDGGLVVRLRTQDLGVPGSNPDRGVRFF